MDQGERASVPWTSGGAAKPKFTVSNRTAGGGAPGGVAKSYPSGAGASFRPPGQSRPLAATSFSTSGSGSGSHGAKIVPSQTFAAATVLCTCGLPAKSVVTKKPGPNCGRPFLSCSKAQGEQCKFFKWMDEEEKAPLQTRPLPVAGPTTFRNADMVQYEVTKAISYLTDLQAALVAADFVVHVGTPFSVTYQSMHLVATQGNYQEVSWRCCLRELCSIYLGEPPSLKWVWVMISGPSPKDPGWLRSPVPDHVVYCTNYDTEASAGGPRYKAVGWAVIPKPALWKHVHTNVDFERTVAVTGEAEYCIYMDPVHEHQAETLVDLERVVLLPGVRLFGRQP